MNEVVEPTHFLSSGKVIRQLPYIRILRTDLYRGPFEDGGINTWRTDIHVHQLFLNDMAAQRVGGSR